MVKINKAELDWHEINMAKLNQAKPIMAKLSQAKIFSAKLNHGLNISWKFLNFICQIYLNIFLANAIKAPSEFSKIHV